MSRLHRHRKDTKIFTHASLQISNKMSGQVAITTITEAPHTQVFAHKPLMHAEDQNMTSILVNAHFMMP